MSTYKQAFDRLNKAQKTAVTTTDGPVLVIAGPGTGKTQLLTTRIAHILATTDTLPQNILCLTFTDSAAQTMQERLGDMIGQEAYDVTISTYHAFGSDIIRRFPDHFADQADLQPIDDLGIDRTFRAIIASLPYSNPLKYSDAYLPDIKTLISDAKRALLTPQDLRTIATKNLHFIKTASPIVQHTLQGLYRIDKKTIPLFQQLHTALAHRDSQTRRTGFVIQETQAKRSRKVAAEPRVSAATPPRESGFLDHETSALTQTTSLEDLLLENLETALEQTNKTGKTQSLTAWKNTWLAKDMDGQFIIDGTKANQKLLAAADIYEKYLAELKARNLFDYDDMILRAVQALETHSDLRYTLQEQYLYILLDEFQDTNGAQLRLAELLTDNPVNEGRPNVLAVGDDDQAIYAFQGANYSHMLKFKDMYKNVLAVPLTQNYRSHTEVLQTARGIAEQIEERLHHHFPSIEKTLTAENTSLPKEAIIERREAQSDVMQYAWTARRIRKLIDSGVPPSEIAVLAPKHKYIEPLLPFLQQQSIPVRYEKRENVLDDPGVHQLLRMSELCLALAANETARANALWAEVLSFGFWKLPTSLIWHLSWQTTDEERSWTDELLQNAELKPIALFFIRLGQLVKTETLETMLDYLIGSIPLDLNEPGYTAFRSPYYEHYFGQAVDKSAHGGEGDTSESQEFASTAGESTANPVKRPGEAEAVASEKTSVMQADFWNLLTNLIVLRARLREYRRDNDDRLYLNDFIDFIIAHRAADLKILNTSPYASGTEAVRLMTAFKAKGMEFAAVFVLAVNDEAWGSKARSTGSRISLPPNLQFIRYAGATNDERLRLFYVAITRAKSQLYLVSHIKNYAGKAMTRLKYLNETTDEYGVVHSPLLPPDKQLVQPAEDSTLTPTTELAAYWQRRHEQALTSTDMRSLLQDRLRHFQLSHTHLADFIDIVHCGPHHFFLKTLLRFPQTPRAEMQFGNAMHETLEWIHIAAKQNGELPETQAILKAYERRLQAKRLSQHDETQYLERGNAALKAYIEQRTHTIALSNVVEHDFKNEGVLTNKAHLAGKIDKLIIDRQAKTIAIVDYKTGKGFSKWARDIKLHKYRKQLYFYKLLVEGSHSFAGYTVTDAYLEFVEPDEAGNIQELHLSFEPNEAQRLQKLIENIWLRVTTLNLPDTTNYSKDLAGIETFEEDLLTS
ncbi:MAG TPA: ATP-dependent DNA helicase [Candidatus Saccharimonadales bacterium]|nr:ATP-dependent DNA helicase [Candidatus Saccharimonadales bacterium]